MGICSVTMGFYQSMSRFESLPLEVDKVLSHEASEICNHLRPRTLVQPNFVLRGEGRIFKLQL